MPANATIASFYTFSANTKARASEVNTNFNNFRGHLIPIDPNTISAIDNTYDLGSTVWRWRGAYINSIYFNGQTTTSSPFIRGQTSITSGAMEIMLGAVTSAVFNNTGMSGSWLNNLSVTDTKLASNAVTTNKIADYNVSAIKLGTSSAEDVWVRERMAGQTFGSIGTINMFFYIGTTTLTVADLAGGGNLRYTNIAALTTNYMQTEMVSAGAGSSVSGSWRYLGSHAIFSGGAGTTAPAGLFLRVI